MSLLKYISAICLSASAAGCLAQAIPQDETGFTEFVAAQLRKEIGDEKVTIKGPLTLSLGELQGNLDRVFKFCNTNTSGCSAELDRYAKAIAEVHRERNAPPTKEAIRVVVRTSQYVQAVQSNAGGNGQIPMLPRPFVEGLVALPAIDSPRAIKMLGAMDAKTLGLSEQDAYDLGLANLRKDLKPLMEVAKIAGKGQIGQLTGDSFNPSRLLLIDSWAPLAREQNGILIAAIPSTDAVLYIGEDTPAAIDALRALVQRVISRAPNRLSSTLLRYKESGWEVVPQQ